MLTPDRSEQHSQHPVIHCLWLALLLSSGCQQAAPPAAPVLPLQAATVKDPTPTLAPGAQLSLPVAAGWLNAAPKSFNAQKEGLIVVDVFGMWCPVVKETAPALLELRQKYADKNVTWVSISSDREGSARALIQASQIDWPVGYGATTEQINTLGAFNASSGMLGYETKPTLYLLRPTGEVLWSDDHARMQHCLPAELQARLAAEIDKHLTPASPDSAPQK